MDGQDKATQPSIAETAFRVFIRTYGLVRRFNDPFFAQNGISASQWAVLRVLWRAEKDGRSGLRLIDLGERLLVRPPSVTGVVDRLQRMGLVTRIASQTDLRAKYVSLTETGRGLIERMRNDHTARVRAMLGVLSEQDQRKLQDLLSRIGENLEALAGRVPAKSAEAPEPASGLAKTQARRTAVT